MMNLFSLALRANGFNLKKATQKLYEITAISEAHYQTYVEAQKKAIYTHHLTHNKFYNNFVKNKPLTAWEDIPVLTKIDLQIPLNKRLAKGFTAKNVYVNKTSGSSGDPFLFAKDNFCHALTWAAIIQRFNWYNIDFNKDYQARFYGIPFDKKGYYKERLKDFISRRYRFSVFNLTASTFERTLQTFSKKRFTYINGYTSAIVLFAKFLNKKNIILKTICPSLKHCFVTSEMLFKEDRILLENQLGIPVINEYGASELGLIAFENKEGFWQVNSETLFVEILDDANKPLPLGEEGRVVVTSLYNKAHPFIRYDLGDVGALSTQSTLKNPILQNLRGRTNDFIKLPSGKTAVGLTFYYVTKSIIEDDGLVKEFVIHQTKLAIFKILYVSSVELSNQKKEAIKKEIATYLEPNLNVIFERKAFINRSKSGKLKQFVSLLNEIN